MNASLKQVNDLFRLKTLLLVLIAFLLLTTAVTVWLSLVRKQKFLQMRAHLLTTISHELKTPLASLRLMGETLHNRLGDETKAKDYPERMVKDIDGLSQLVEDILAFSRIDGGHYNLQKQKLNLQDMLVDLQAELNAELSKTVTWKNR